MSRIIAPSRGGNRVLTAAQMLAFLRTNVRINEDGCHVWAGTGDKRPTVVWGGRRHSARRLMSDLALGGAALPERHVAWATCGHRMCMNEGHIRVGTHRDAMRGKSASGQLHRGIKHTMALAKAFANHPRVKIPMSERFNVSRMRAEGWTWKRIAAHYGTSIGAPFEQMKNWERIFGPSAYWTEPVGFMR